MMETPKASIIQMPLNDCQGTHIPQHELDELTKRIFDCEQIAKELYSALLSVHSEMCLRFKCDTPKAIKSAKAYFKDKGGI